MENETRKVTILNAKNVKEKAKEIELHSDFDTWFSTLQMVHELSKELNLKSENYFAIVKEKEFCKECNDYHLHDLSFSRVGNQDMTDDELEAHVCNEIWDHVFFMKDISETCMLVSMDKEHNIEKIKAAKFEPKTDDGVEFSVKFVDITDYYADFLMKEVERKLNVTHKS